MIASWFLRLTGACAILLAFGLVWLLAYVLVEATIGQGGGSMVDAYWLGRLPWVGIAETLIVSGATATAIAGALASIIGGGWIRRLAVVPPLGIIGLWWLLAMAIRRAVPCETCPPPTPDPWAYAYSAPENALLFLLVPAVAIAIIALAAKPASRAAYISPS
ncbi:MAG TPA: hypothetical protein VFH90_04985 [Candidatus Limnocylindria bacterium]|nr:hypothetical protein [Candidatus Limnocylindria bacterium]